MHLRADAERICLCRLCFEDPTAIKLGAGGGVYNFKVHLYRHHPYFLARVLRDDKEQSERSSTGGEAAPSVARRRRRAPALHR
jgi:hypothetical protein